MSFQTAKAAVRAFHDALEKTDSQSIAGEIKNHVARDYTFRGVHPFNEIDGAEAVAEQVWMPLKEAFTSLQRRTDIFFASDNSLEGAEGQWVCCMGNFLGLHDAPWLDIPPTRRLGWIRFAEFNRVVEGRIAETALFIDILGVMHQAGVYPLGPQTGAHFMYPGPRTHDGLLYDDEDPTSGQVTLELVDAMVADLGRLNLADNQRMPAKELAKCWTPNMLWYGPFGIGATYTIERYQQQHQYPFRLALKDKTFNGHVARFAEGHYAGFFGWPNLSNRNSGGFLGQGASESSADMRVVDVYRREGDRLAENWVFIDMLHYFNMQGFDVLKRMRQLAGREAV